MGFAQVMQVVISFAVILLAIFLAYKMAKKGNLTGQGKGMKLISRAGISRTQNLVVAEVNGKQHLIAMSDGGSVVVDSWAAPEPEEQEDGQEPAIPFADFLTKAKDKAGSMVAGTQWSGLAKQKAAQDKAKASGSESHVTEEEMDSDEGNVPESVVLDADIVENKADSRDAFFGKAKPATEVLTPADSEDPEIWLDTMPADPEYGPIGEKVGSTS